MLLVIQVAPLVPWTPVQVDRLSFYDLEMAVRNKGAWDRKYHSVDVETDRYSGRTSVYSSVFLSVFYFCFYVRNEEMGRVQLYNAR